MDLLRTAMVDITTMVATCHALKFNPAESALVLPRKLRSRQRRDIKCGTVAYVDALARTRRGVVDDGLLCTCRMAAEHRMPQALAHQVSLGHITVNQAGSLDSLAAARQGIWRLEHLAVWLSSGMASLRGFAPLAIDKSTNALIRRLGRSLRKALIAHGRAALRTKASTRRFVAKAREAVLAEIGPRDAAEADRLADVEACTPIQPSTVYGTAWQGRLFSWPSTGSTASRRPADCAA